MVCDERLIQKGKAMKSDYESCRGRPEVMAGKVQNGKISMDERDLEEVIP